MFISGAHHRRHTTCKALGCFGCSACLPSIFSCFQVSGPHDLCIYSFTLFPHTEELLLLFFSRTLQPSPPTYWSFSQDVPSLLLCFFQSFAISFSRKVDMLCPGPPGQHLLFGLNHFCLLVATALYLVFRFTLLTPGLISCSNCQGNALLSWFHLLKSYCHLIQM